MDLLGKAIITPTKIMLTFKRLSHNLKGIAYGTRAHAKSLDYGA